MEGGSKLFNMQVNRVNIEVEDGECFLRLKFFAEEIVSAIVLTIKRGDIRIIQASVEFRQIALDGFVELVKKNFLITSDCQIDHIIIFKGVGGV